jgi:geranylgeranyl diphosphate synthase, type I
MISIDWGTLMTAEIVEAPVKRTVERMKEQVDALLKAHLEVHGAPVADAELDEGYGLLTRFVLNGGKRIRPLLCALGARGAGHTDERQALTVGAALECYHAGLLIHDDIMDGSALRRGRPTIHRALAHRGELFGQSAATLLGVQALAWADELLDQAGAQGQVRALFHRMRAEVIAGQYLDIRAHRFEDPSIDRALTVIRYKTAKYTVERPLQIGGALAGAPPELMDSYAAFGLPLGEAFQLRDDILGVFGDPARTGKPVIDDLREGKSTVLVARAFAEAAGPQRQLLRAWHGNPRLDEEHAADLRQVIVDTQALAHVEDMIERRVRAGLKELRACAMDEDARAALVFMADRLTHRNS